MNKFIISLVCLLFFGFAFDVKADDLAEKKKAVYFYSETCAHCEKVNAYFQQEKIYEAYDIEKIECSGPYNTAYLNSFFDAFSVPADKRGFPAIFFQDRMILGDEPIINNFVKEIGMVSAHEVPTPEKITVLLQVDNENEKYSSEVSLLVLIWAALVDAINPCAFAVLILLVTTVISAEGRRGGLYSGLTFSLAIFVSYFLMGLGLYKAIGFFNLPKIFSIIIGTVAIIIGLANLKDFFWYGKIFVMEVPFSWRPKMQSIIRNVTSPVGALGAGFLVSLFLLPCTSGPYIVILGLLAQKKDLIRTISLLAIYNLIFVLPMIGITVAMYFGVRARGLEDWRKKNIRLLHLVAGATMLFIGMYLVYSWV
jgi:cytochrome c biogenesis protein CcdA/glutaredoxin-related protein